MWREFCPEDEEKRRNADAAPKGEHNKQRYSNNMFSITFLLCLPLFLCGSSPLIFFVATVVVVTLYSKIPPNLGIRNVRFPVWISTMQV